MSSTSAVSVLAQGLRELRDFAEGPDGAELQNRTGLTGEQIEAALGGTRLPTREVTLALVEAWEGDVEAWREYWGQIAALAEEQDGGGKGRGGGEGGQKAATPTPPEPSIITPIPEAEPQDAGAAEAELADKPADEPADEQDEAVRARSAARAQLEANAQAAKAQSQARAAAAQEQARAEDAEDAGDAGDAGDTGSGTAKADGPGQPSAENEGSAEAGKQERERAEGQDAGSDEPEPSEKKPGGQARAGNAAGSADPAASVVSGAADADAGAGVAPGSGAAATGSVGTAAKPGKPAGSKQAGPPATVVVPSKVIPAQPQPPKKRPLARVGVPVLLFAIGVGVGAFGDHALNSKQSSTTTTASLPPVSATSRPTHSSVLSPSSAATSSSNPTALATSSSTNPTATGTPPSEGGASTSSTAAPGTVLGTYVGIQLASGYSVNFLADPYHPAAGTSNGPDTMGFFATSFVDGRFYADRVAVLSPTETGSYTSCLNNTRYQHDVLLSQVAANSTFCITTGTGHLVAVTVRQMPSSTDANPYAVLDMTVWQAT